MGQRSISPWRIPFQDKDGLLRAILFRIDHVFSDSPIDIFLPHYFTTR